MGPLSYRSHPPHWTWRQLRSSPRESWAFFFALTAKVDWDTAPATLARKLEEAVRSLACSDPEGGAWSLEPAYCQ